MTKQQHQSTTEALGVPYDSAAADRAMSLYDAITRGDHDQALDKIEHAAKQRRSRYDHKGARTRLPDGIEDKPIEEQVWHGYYSRAGGGGDSMNLILEAVHNRRVDLHNAAVHGKVDQLKANPPQLRADDRVMVRVDAPLRDPVLLGKQATVVKPLKVNTTVRFDDDQALGKFAGKAVRVPTWALEKMLDPVDVLLVTQGGRQSSALRDETGRVRVRHGRRYGWAPLGPITWDDE